MLTIDSNGQISRDGKVIAFFHADPERNGRYVAYWAGERDHAKEWNNPGGCGPTFAKPEQVLEFLNLAEE